MTWWTFQVDPDTLHCAIMNRHVFIRSLRASANGYSALYKLAHLSVTHTHTHMTSRVHSPIARRLRARPSPLQHVCVSGVVNPQQDDGGT